MFKCLVLYTFVARISFTNVHWTVNRYTLAYLLFSWEWTSGQVHIYEYILKRSRVYMKSIYRLSVGPISFKRDPALHCPALSCAFLHCSTALCILLPCPAFSCTVLNCREMSCTVLRGTALSCTDLHGHALSCCALLYRIARPCTALNCLALALPWMS